MPRGYGAASSFSADSGSSGPTLEVLGRGGRMPCRSPHHRLAQKWSRVAPSRLGAHVLAQEGPLIYYSHHALIINE